MSVEKNIRFDRQKSMEQPSVFQKMSRVNLNDLMKKLKEEEKKTKRNNLLVSAAALSAVAVFGIILTL